MTDSVNDSTGAPTTSFRNAATVRQMLTKYAKLQNKPVNNPPTTKPCENYPPPIKRRAVLDIDNRFFPRGVQPGMLIELKGPEGSGKTFLCTYFLARFLFVNPTQIAVFVDATLHFSVENLVSMLKFMDPEIRQDSDNKKLLAYLARVFVIKCTNIDELLMVLDSKYMDPYKKSQLEDMLLKNPDICLIFVDGIDQFPFIQLHGKCDVDLNVINLLRKSVESTHAPVICTIHEIPPTAPVPVSRRSKYRRSYVQLNTKLFTHTMTLQPLQDQEMTEDQMKLATTLDEIQNEINSPSTRPEAYAYLRRNDADVSHRVKFSILSGMLWVCEDSGDETTCPPVQCPTDVDGELEDVDEVGDE